MLMREGAMDESRSKVVFQIFLVSLALMMFETSLIRLFSVLMLHHLAFFVLAIALFGLGLGALFAHLTGGGVNGWFARRKALLPLFLTFSLLLTVILLSRLPLRIHAPNVAVMFRWLFIAFVGASLPFFFGGAYISLLFAANPKGANRLYFSDLLGASLGCLLAVPALQWLGGVYTPFLVAMFAATPVLLEKESRWLRRTGIVCILGVAALAFANTQTHFFRVSGVTPGKTEVFAKWNFFSLIAIEECPEWRGWRLSRKYDGPIPDHRKLLQDGRAPAFLVKHDGDFGKLDYLKYDITAIPYYLKSPKNVLVIGAGGGRDLLTAKLFGVPEVTGVELNPITVDAMKGPFSEYTGGIYTAPGVNVYQDNGRTFLQRDRNQYELIYTSLADTQAANTQGAYVLSENHLYTTEAYANYFDRLAPGGACCSVCGTGWGDFAIRLITTMSQALESRGIKDPARHILVVVTPDFSGVGKAMCIVMTKDPVPQEMVDGAKAACAKLDFALAWPPSDIPHNWTPKIAALTDASKRDAFLPTAAVDLSALTDNTPYLFYTVKRSDFLSFMLRPWMVPEVMEGAVKPLYVLVDIFLVVFICVVVMMLSPLLLLRRAELRTGARGVVLGMLAVAFLLGLGYMLVEISLLQSMFLLVGDPTLTFSVILCFMLVFTGLGSRASGSLAESDLPNRLMWIGGIAFVLLTIAAFLLPGIVHLTQGFVLPLRLLVAVVALALPAFLMGMLFPNLLRLQAGLGMNTVCWLWGMNGVGSVLGSVGATIVSMNFGIAATFVTGAACYLLVALVVAVAFRRVKVGMPT
jgi:MFS family permease